MPNYVRCSARRFWAPAAKRRLGIWGLWLCGWAMPLREGELALFMLRSPNLPIPAVFSVPSVLIYNTREAPCSSLVGAFFRCF